MALKPAAFIRLPSRANPARRGADNEEVEVSEAEYTDISDAHDRSFNDDWLPEWRLLKRLEFLKVSVKGTQAKLPVAFGGTDRQGVWCYAYGQKGHKKGSE